MGKYKSVGFGLPQVAIIFEGCIACPMKLLQFIWEPIFINRMGTHVTGNAMQNMNSAPSLAATFMTAALWTKIRLKTPLVGGKLMAFNAALAAVCIAFFAIIYNSLAGWCIIKFSDNGVYANMINVIIYTNIGVQGYFAITSMMTVVKVAIAAKKMLQLVLAQIVFGFVYIFGIWIYINLFNMQWFWMQNGVIGTHMMGVGGVGTSLLQVMICKTSLDAASGGG